MKMRTLCLHYLQITGRNPVMELDTDLLANLLE